MTSFPSYNELKAKCALTSNSKKFIEINRNTITQILKGEDPRLLLIIGPCSIHDKESALEFARNLSILSEKVSDKFFIVMRTYVEKARTTIGWKGFLYDPYLNRTHDVYTGLCWTRQLLIDLIDLKVPTATEFLDPLMAPYYEDLICWGSIGARTSSSQPHRQWVSSLQLPIGIKNCVGGSISAAIQGCYTASHPHTFIALNELGYLSLVNSQGNPNTHIVLRGGESGSNFDSESILYALHELEKYQLPKRLLIDCSHGNSKKQYKIQLDVFRDIISQFQSGNRYIRGALIESHLFDGNQDFNSNPSHLRYGVSITDSCLGWKSTEELILEQAEKLRGGYAL
jgi:3-deoxy-7-phosphoheptulonate synthase